MALLGRNGRSGGARGEIFVKLNALVLILALTGIMIMVNLIADKLPWTYDMTATKIYTLSDQTKRVIASLKKPVHIVAFFQEGSDNQRIRALLEEYRKAGRERIRLEYVDAERNPEVARSFDYQNEGIGNGNILFIAGDRIKKINQFEVETPSEYGKDFNGEPLFTGALLHVTAPRFQKIYFLEGHNELSPAVDLLKLSGRIEADASKVAALNLLQSGAVPGDADALIIAAPKRDLQSGEMANLRDYLAKGGRAVFLFDVLGPGTRLVNFNNLLQDYNVAIQNNFVAEEDPRGFYANRKNYLVPEYTDQKIVVQQQVANLLVFLPYAGRIQFTKTLNPMVKIEPLLHSSSKSWIRTDVADTRPTQTAADLSGPADLAVAVTRNNSALKYRETKFVVVYNARFVMDNMLDVQGNFDFFMNSLSWIEDRQEAVVVRPKLLDTHMMFLRDDQKVMLMIGAIFLLPLLPFGVGLSVWLRRRHA